ncbi:hypothetical protein D3C81_1690030 [compost metagenome]
MTRRLQALDQQTAGGVGIQGTGIADRQDGNVQGDENAFGVLAHQEAPRWVRDKKDLIGFIAPTRPT